MSTSNFAFVPRKLAKPGRLREGIKKPRIASNHHSQREDEHKAATSASHETRKGRDYLDDSSYTALFELALSEFALWSNAELVEAMEANKDGFVPISYLVQTSSVFAGLSVIPPETVLIRAIRLSGVLECRLIVSGPSSSDWYGKSRRNDVGTEGGSEVRRRDWAKVLERTRKHTSFHWDSKTIYVENLPHHARTYLTVHQFIQQILVGRSNTESEAQSIQSISFPHHHKDGPDARPPAVSKGFAFVTLSHPRDLDYLLECWPWNREERPADSKADELSKVAQEAQESGFRCLSKHKWDELKEEYLGLQRRLLEKTMRDNAPGPYISKPYQLKNGAKTQNEGMADSSSDKPSEVSCASESPAWFPKDCLVFVKNVHPETNKTTLRALFASAFDKDDSPIDYVDYSKGLDSCYLRLSKPSHARTLASYFSEHRIVQANALDNVGGRATGDTAVEIELVQGKKEEVYWEKVPEKIRQAAITKAQDKAGNGPPVEKNNNSAAGRKRKRRKHD